MKRKKRAKGTKELFTMEINGEQFDKIEEIRARNDDKKKKVTNRVVEAGIEVVEENNEFPERD